MLHRSDSHRSSEGNLGAPQKSSSRDFFMENLFVIDLVKTETSIRIIFGKCYCRSSISLIVIEESFRRAHISESKAFIENVVHGNITVLRHIHASLLLSSVRYFLSYSANKHFLFYSILS